MSLTYDVPVDFYRLEYTAPRNSSLLFFTPAVLLPMFLAHRDFIALF